MKSLLDLLAMKCGPSLRLISWPHICLQGINDLLRVFGWVGSRFGAPQNLALMFSTLTRSPWAAKRAANFTS